MHHRNSGRQPPYMQYRCQVSRSDMDEELAPDNQGIDDMSFKDLIVRAAAAITLKPTETASTPATQNEAKAPDTEVPAKPKTS